MKQDIFIQGGGDSSQAASPALSKLNSLKFEDQKSIDEVFSDERVQEAMQKYLKSNPKALHLVLGVGADKDIKSIPSLNQL